LIDKILLNRSAKR